MILMMSVAGVGAIGYNNIYNPPTMLLEFYDRLSFRIIEQDEEVYRAETSYAPLLWQTEEWVHIRATWRGIDQPVKMPYSSL